MKIRHTKKHKRIIIIERNDDVSQIPRLLRGCHVDRIRIPIEYLFNGSFDTFKEMVLVDICFGKGSTKTLFWGDVVFYR